MPAIDSGWLWLIADIICVIVFAMALTYGTKQWCRWERSRHKDAAQATKELYKG
jgi:hypothetical protein